MKYTQRHGLAELETCSGESNLTVTDTASSGGDSDGGGADDFFASSSESEAKSVPQWKHESAPDPSGGDSNASVPSPDPDRDTKASANSEEDRYNYSSESSDDEKKSDGSSETVSSSESSDSADDNDSSGDEEDVSDGRSSRATSASASSETIVSEKQTEKQKAQNERKPVDLSLLDLYPKSLSLVGLSSGKDQMKEEATPSRPKSSASTRPRLQTRVLRRSESLEEFTSSLPERFKRQGWHMDNTELIRLNEAVYEAWYFHKEEQMKKLKMEAIEKKLQEKTSKPRKLFQKTVPRKTRRLKMYDHVQMKITKEDPVWEWLEKKLINMKKSELKAKAKATEEREAQEKRKASKQEEGALAFAAWKTRKDELSREKCHKERRQAREKARAEEENAVENRISAGKVFEQYKERVAAEEREEARRRRQRQRRQADRTAQMLEARDIQAQARYHQWLQGAAERYLEQPDSAGRHTPPPRRPPWYPGGTLGAGRPSTDPSPPRSDHPSTASRPSGGRGWRPCRQTHCPACPCAPAATAVPSTSVPDAQLTVDQAVTCASRRAVFVLRCLFCNLQYVGWTLQSVRSAFARQLRALQEEAGSTLAEHVAEHRRSSERFVPLTECLRLTGVRAFSESASRHAVADFAHVAKEILGTVSPDGLNRH